MSTKHLQPSVTAGVWRAIAQSGIDVSNINREDLDQLVRIVVDAALEEVDAQFEEFNQTQTASENNEDVDTDEQILWQGRPFLSLTLTYVITNERVRIIDGLFGKSYQDIELVRVQDVDFKQSLTERALHLGDIYIASHDPSAPAVVLQNVKDPQTVHETLRRAVINARKVHKLSYREEM